MTTPIFTQNVWTRCDTTDVASQGQHCNMVPIELI